MKSLHGKYMGIECFQYFNTTIDIGYLYLYLYLSSAKKTSLIKWPPFDLYASHTSENFVNHVNLQWHSTGTVPVYNSIFGL